MRPLHPLLCALSLMSVCAVAEAQQNPYAAIDRHALAAPKDAERSLDTLAAYLTQPMRPERDRARAIFRWTTERVRFNADAHATGHPGELHPDTVLGDREATAFGYANLFDALARRAGLETAIIHGYAKMKHHSEEGMLTKVKHAWNAVRVDGHWYFVDTCWGSGYLKLQRWQRVFQEQYFLATPGQMILTHLPLDPRWQLVQPAVTPEQFDARPVTHQKFVNFGIKADAKAHALGSPDHRNFGLGAGTQMFLQTGKIKVIAAPAPGSTLTRGNAYPFVIETADVTQMALWNNGYWILLHKNGTRFEGGIYPEPGDLRLCLQRPNDPHFQSVVGYKVSER